MSPTDPPGVPASEDAPVLVTRPAPGICQLTLNRPDRLNTMTHQLVTDLHRALDEVAADRDVRAVVLTGAGRGFCAGLELTGYGDNGREEEMGRSLGALDRQREIARLTQKIHDLPHPVIAAVNGPAAGGGLALVLASDIRIAADPAVFAVSFIRAGFSACDIGTSWLLPRIVGAGHAHELMLTGRRFDAAEAERIGLLHRVVAPADLLPVAHAKAAEIMLNPPGSVSLTKQGMWASLEMPSLATAIEFENRQQMVSAWTEDAAEARAAFLEKRPPAYQHR
ncbi:enoyl-CoA hydratase/isomerase family protein [Nocardioides insulae]|uniref:enoyl-CoA hydratase/isomerase family protein n=1 Tax=Nocardioides insulae TaxID=394734 RepID=UPI0003F6CEFD|nr:enoyl-CoA hydratase/isomerase family protein [Nocardioides insulae]